MVEGIKICQASSKSNNTVVHSFLPLMLLIELKKKKKASSSHFNWFGFLLLRYYFKSMISRCSSGCRAEALVRFHWIPPIIVSFKIVFIFGSRLRRFSIKSEPLKPMNWFLFIIRIKVATDLDVWSNFICVRKKGPQASIQRCIDLNDISPNCKNCYFFCEVLS